MADAVLAITATALERVRGFLSSTADPDERVLLARVTGASGGEYVSALTLESRSRIRPGDHVQEQDGVALVVAADSVDRLRGATIDWSEAPGGAGFVVLNPNRPPREPMQLPTLPMMGGGPPPPPPRPSRPPVGLDTELARRVMDVLDREVNPAIAAHGGHAELAAIEGSTAYLRLGGGCQGCGMATVTLSQGIEVAITELVPGIERVVDVTDHASGTNPYYEPAKK